MTPRRATTKVPKRPRRAPPATSSPAASSPATSSSATSSAATSSSAPGKPGSPRQRLEAKQQRVHQGLAILRRAYPDPTISLAFRNPFELVCAVALSAQATDASVNLATPELFARYPTPAAMARAEVRDLERLIQRIGLYRGKARRLKAMAQLLEARFDGQVPQTMAELMELPGVARKTANVVLWNGFRRIEGIAIDTHAGRVARRLGWTKHEDPVKVEQELMRFVPREDWGIVTHLLIAHGRATCMARAPACEGCPLLALCPTGPRILTERDARATRATRMKKGTRSAPKPASS